MIQKVKLSKKEWEKSRSTLIGASELSTILGINKYETPEQFFERKLYGIEKEKTEAMEIGTQLEPTIAKMFTKQTKIKLVKNKDSFIIDNCIIATPDYFSTDNKVIEIKSMGDYAYSNTKFYKGIPEYYYPQIQAYLFIANQLYNQDKGFFVILHGNKLDIIEIEFDEEYFNHCFEKAKEFQKMLINKNYEKPANVEAQPIFGIDEDIEEIYNELVRINELISKLNEQKDELINKIKEYMLDKEETKYARWQEQERFDTKSFKEFHPDIYEQFKVKSKVLKINYKGIENGK